MLNTFKDFMADFTNLAYTCFIIFMIIVIVASCAGGGSAPASAQPQPLEYQNDWKLVGVQGNCKLYMKCVPLDIPSGSCSRVFWSICSNGNGDTGTVSAD